METNGCQSPNCLKNCLSNRSLCVEHFIESLRVKFKDAKPAKAKPQQGATIFYPTYELYGPVKYIKKRGAR
jgi:hypothetical protein